MRLAYADPPYLGCCKLYGLHAPCGESGARRADHERAARAGWIEIDCGETTDTFYMEGTET